MEQQAYKIEGHPQFVKIGHAVINNDKSAYEQWLGEQLEKKSLVDRINKLEQMVQQMLLQRNE